MNDFSLKIYDRLPVLRANLSDDGGYLNLDGSTVRFVYQDRYRRTPAVTGNASILGATSGYVQYTWATGDTSSVGVYYGEWRVSMSDGRPISVPNDSFFSFEIVEGLS